MTYSIDVNGNDNQPEWGYCAVPDCGEEAFPIWTSGEYPDDPDLFLCPTHIGARLFELEKQRTDAQADAAMKLQALDCLLLFVERGTFLSDTDRTFILSARQPSAGAPLLAELERAETARKAAIARGAADHAVAEAARILAAGPDSTAWEGMYAALAVVDKAGAA